MTFWNKGVKPYPYNGIKIQDFGNTPTNERIARHHGVDGSEAYAVNKNAILCFASDYYLRETNEESKRVVTFKAFIEGFKMSFGISRDIEESKKSIYRPDYLDNIAITYSLSFNVVAHSVNEAISNMAKFSELERILTYPFLRKENEGDPLKQRNPRSYMLFSNLINNGRYWENFNSETFSYTFRNIRKYGLRISVGNISMDPDLEMGVFEYDGQTYFKSYTIKMDIMVPNYKFQDSARKEYSYENILAGQGQSPSAGFFYKFYEPMIYDSKLRLYKFSSLTTGDTKGFPFNIPGFNGGVGWKSVNGRTVVNQFIGDMNKNVDTTVQTYSDNKSISLSISPNKPELLGASTLEGSLIKFDCFLESFNYSKEQMVTTPAVAGAAVAVPVFDPGHKISIDFKINVVSNSLKQAMKNCLKLSYLYRLVALSSGDVPVETVSCFLMSNLIKSPSSSGKFSTYTLADTINNGLKVVVQSADLEVDEELGYYEYGVSFIPKAFSLSFSIETLDSGYGKMIVNNVVSKEDSFFAESDSIKWPFGISYDDPKNKP
mgnify:CR=1 FL=1|tara:strand:- start:5343 stop:6983 length:1641 start_codon:yes stop_codon:yes gene_type:complete